MKERHTAKIRKAKKLSGSTSSREGAEEGLDLDAFRQEVLEGIDRIAGKRLIQDVFGPWPKGVPS